jgi:hypothetical protein
MAGPVAQQASAWVMDDETRAAIFEGPTVNQLAIAFGLGPQIVARRLAAIQPTGKRGRWATYKLADAAAYLVEPKGDIEERIKRMNHRDLPPMLLKEFWTGLRAKQAWEAEERDLWRTTQVVETLAEVFRALRMSVLLMSDTIERETGLTERQRQRLQEMADAALESMYESLISRFGGDADFGPADAAQSAAAADEYGGL